MNAPFSEALAQALAQVSLDDKYTLTQGRAFMSGVQALVKLPLLQRLRDAQQGKNTAGFISGYRGSPLGSYDLALWKAAPHLQAQNIVFQPGVNEELAATALWGTQQLGFAPAGTQRFDGVFGIWYGKGPGVDRCADVFKHANMAGTTPWGGVLAVAGDDHVAKSSTVAHQSDHIFKACGLPVFFPASVQEILDMGLHAIAMSRYSGVWASMKTIQEIVESSATVELDTDRVKILWPTDFEMPADGVHIRWPDTALEQEQRLFRTKWYAALAYIRANRLNHTTVSTPQDQFGIMASGKAWNDTRQALLDLGLDDATCQRLGIRLHKVGVVWPLEAQTTREFACGLREVLVVEEKRQVIEYQLKEELYHYPDALRPNVVGKYRHDSSGFAGGEWSHADPSAEVLLRANADLSPALIARAIVQRLRHLGLLQHAGAELHARISAHIALLDAKEAGLQTLAQAVQQGMDRPPWFCSGCPHNTSTVVPEGSRAMAGIGCHFMATWMDRSTVGFTQMGGEGVPWIGQQPFSTEPHVFANLGDGTYFHSGLLAVRQSIAAGVNITYKILYNDAVAMTGGQPVGERPEGHSVLQIAHSLRAEGAQKITIVTDEPEKYAALQKDPQGLPLGIAIQHRDTLGAVQREFREIKGTTVIIYDQTCATEKRRRRKRGTLADPAKWVVINEWVCEGCGDCGVQSNCLSVEPLETEWGRKRTINQSSCNKDYSCLQGFCPSMVTVEGGTLKQQAKTKTNSQKEDPSQQPSPLQTALPEPDIARLQTALDEFDGVWGIVVAGVGGTGVITIGQLLGMAAHLEGKGVVTQDAAGLAQKGGATWSHVLLARDQATIRTTRVATAAADVVLGCDPIVTASPETWLRLRAGRTRVALNTHSTPTAAFVKNADWLDPSQRCGVEIEEAVGTHGVARLDAERIATELMGDSIYVNPVVLGFAWQKGWIPLGLSALRRAIELNQVAVAQNLRAFEWGRLAAEKPEALQSALSTTQVLHFMRAPTSTRTESIPALVARRVAYLTDYQNAAYAQSYQHLVEQVRTAEMPLVRSVLTEAVARNLFKLMAYKDEYEVARLQSDPAFLDKLKAQFDGPFTLNYHLAPPWLARKNEKGQAVKRAFGPATLTGFRWLARLKALRGTPWDPFGRSPERQTERALVAQYRACIQELCQGLRLENHALAVEIARLPDQIRGFGHVKARNLAAVQTQWDHLMSLWRAQA